MKKCLKLVVALSFILSFQSCGSNEPEEEQEVIGNNCLVEWFSTQSTVILEAGLAYGLNATDENCKAYQDAIALWINEAEDCDLVTQADIEEAQMDLDELDCN